MYCTKCGAKNEGGSAYCRNCGNMMNQNGGTPEPVVTHSYMNAAPVYDSKHNSSPFITELKKLGKYPFFIVGLILYGLGIIYSFIYSSGFLSALNQGLYGDGAYDFSLPYIDILLFIGLLLLFISMNSKQYPGVSTAGPKMLKIVSLIIMIFMSMATFIIFISLFFINRVKEYIEYGDFPEIFGEFYESGFMLIFIFLFAIFALILLTYIMIYNSFRRMERTIKTGSAAKGKFSVFVAVMMIIVIFFTLLSLIATASVSIDELVPDMDGFESEIDIHFVIQSIITMLYSLCFVICIFKYNSIIDKYQGIELFGNMQSAPVYQPAGQENAGQQWTVEINRERTVYVPEPKPEPEKPIEAEPEPEIYEETETIYEEQEEDTAQTEVSEDEAVEE